MKNIIITFVCMFIACNIYAGNNPERIREEAAETTEVRDSATGQETLMPEISMNEVEPEESSTERSLLSGIKKNTDKDFVYDQWNLYGIIAIVIAVIALLAEIIASFYQWNTERHTKNAPISVQRGKLNDLPRHFYRNIVCTHAMIFKHLHPSNGSSADRKCYPSEANMLKLRTLPDDIFLPVDVDEKSYQMIHELKLLFRNYNIEIEVAAEHLSRQHLTDESLRKDFDNLIYKPFMLTRETFKYEEMICKKNEDLNRKAVINIINEHFKKLMEPRNFSILLKSENSFFLRQLLTGELAHIIDKEGSLAHSLKELGDVIINKSSFINSRESDELKTSIGYMTTGEVPFKNWLAANYGNDSQATEQLLSIMKPYINYMSGTTWEFKSMLNYMLAVDVAIETDRIGMINYKPV